LYLGGIGCEAAYNEFFGSQYTVNSDNHSALRIDYTNGAWVHHNYIHGVIETPLSSSTHSLGVLIYYSQNLKFEDNYITACDGGVYDKGWNVAEHYDDNTFRRNWITNCNVFGFQISPMEFQQGREHVYDNVIDSGQPVWM